MWWSGATPDRLAGLLARDIGAADDLAGMGEAHGVFLDLLLDQQLDDLEHGRPPTNAVLVKRLSATERRQLRRALERLRYLDAVRRDLLVGAA